MILKARATLGMPNKHVTKRSSILYTLSNQVPNKHVNVVERGKANNKIAYQNLYNAGRWKDKASIFTPENIDNMYMGLFFGPSLKNLCYPKHFKVEVV